jgi:hypothetical protein
LRVKPEVAAVFSDYQLVNSEGRDLGTIPTALTGELTKLSLINHQRTAHPSVMFRKSAVLDAGGYASSAYPAEDMELWMRLSENSNIASIPETLLIYLKNNKGISAVNNLAMRAKNYELKLKVAEKIDLEKVLHEAETTLIEYDKFDFSEKRKLLFFRDLITFISITENKRFVNSANLAIQFKGHINPSLVPAFVHLAWDKWKRK